MPAVSMIVIEINSFKEIYGIIFTEKCVVQPFFGKSCGINGICCYVGHIGITCIYHTVFGLPAGKLILVMFIVFFGRVSGTVRFLVRFNLFYQENRAVLIQECYRVHLYNGQGVSCCFSTLGFACYFKSDFLTIICF